MFRTEINTIESHFKFGLSGRILSMGSCFADKMGERLLANKFTILNNPFGVIFNPISIHKLLTINALDNEGYVQHQTNWYHYDVHSEFTASSRDELSYQLSSQCHTIQKYLSELDVLILTYGTAFVYERLDTRQMVANCHKQPASHFEKRLLRVAEIIEDFKKLFHYLKNLRPSLRIILTISPVRHIKDSIPLNSVSKAILRLAVHQIVSEFEEVAYFPAFELLLDDLRDYRFYASDMLHPSEVATDYIWDKFKETYLEKETQTFIKKWQKILKAVQHKPFQRNSEAFQAFVAQSIATLLTFKSLVDISEELAYFQSLQQNTNSMETPQNDIVP